MDSVSSRWPILLYFFIAWLIFGSESNFPAIEFSIGKKQALGPTIVSVPAPIAPIGSAGVLTTAAPSATTPSATAASVNNGPTAAQTAPVETNPTAASPAATTDVRAALSVVAGHGRPSAESAELRALRLAEEEFNLNLGATQQASVIPRPEPEAPQSCQPPPPERLASRDWSRGFENGWPTGLQYPRLPVSNDPRVARYIGYFTSTAEGRKTFATWLRRSGKYRDVFAGILEQRRLPTDLAAVAFVESGLWPTAVSKAGATGLWQFMPQTARAYGLEVHDEFDERRSIWRSTEAAADHLKDLYQRFGSWELALAAYNMGYRRLNRALQAAGTDDFWAVSSVTGSLPRETTLYVPKVLAVAIVLNNLSYFSFDDVQPMAALDATPIEVPPGIELSAVARAMGTTVQLLREFNPELPSAVTPNVGRLINVYIPRAGGDSSPPGALLQPRFEPENIEAGRRRPLFGGRAPLPAAEAWPGQTEWLGRLRSTDPAPPGSSAGPEPLGPFDRALRLPAPAKPAEANAAALEPASPQVEWITWGRGLKVMPDPARGFGADLPAPPRPTPIQYRVTPGDTLWAIAKTHGVRESQIANDNHLLDGSLLNTGQLLLLRPSATILQ